MKRPVIVIILLCSAIAFSQHSGEKSEVDTKEYTKFLLKCNQTADNLKFAIRELDVLQQSLSTSDAQIKNEIAKRESLEYLLENQKQYVKHMKKQKRKAWFNGIWQGGIGGGALTLLLLI